MGDRTIKVSEAERDLLVRNAVPCPVCQARKRAACVYGRTVQGNAKRQATSHEGRYVLAAQAGVVPKLVGM